MTTVQMNLRITKIFLVGYLAVQAAADLIPEPKDWFKVLSDLHKTVCPLDTTCTEKLNISTTVPPDKKKYACCGDCSCQSDCFEFGNCCLEMYNSFGHGKAILAASEKYECQKIYFLTGTNYNPEEKFWMISKCAADYRDDYNKELCENPGLNGNVESVLPVTDFKHVVHYRNIFCAFCNGQYDPRDLETWQLQLYCAKVISVNDKNLLAKLEENGCNILYELRFSRGFDDCSDWPPYTIATCNATGLWTSYDQYIDTACQAFADPFNGTYRNYFCYLCNTDEQADPENLKCSRNVWSNIDSFSPSFFAILDLDAVRKMSYDVPNLNCDSNVQFEDFKLVKCRDISCHEISNQEQRKCKVQTDRLKTICYQIFIKMIPIRNMDISDLNFVQNRTLDALDNVRAGLTDIVSEFRFFHKVHDTEVDKIEFILLYFVYDFSRRSLPVKLDDIAILHDRFISVDVEGSYIDFRLEFGVYNVTIHWLHAEIHVTSSYNMSLVDTVKVNLRSPYDLFFSDSCGLKTVWFNKLLSCPFVELRFDEISMAIENGFLIFRRNNSTIKTILKWEYEPTVNGILICLEDYLPIYNALPKPEIHGNGTATYIGPKRILAFVCVCASLSCLIATIAAYCVFSELRSQPGVNNLILCICLFLAQTIYQFGAGQQSLSALACSIIGALCHLLWLSVIFSMNACSVQMFLIFKSHIKKTSEFSKKKTLMTILYISIGSLVLVLLNVVVSLMSGDRDNSGYGGTVCFIRSYKMHLITFIIPTFILLAVNFVLFSYVVNRMRKFNIISSKLNQERNYMGINARLSTLTGLTWMFGFLQIFIKQDFIEYLFIIFNASQGVFIMIAFVCNHRVYSLMFKNSVSRPSEGSANTEKTLVNK